MCSTQAGRWEIGESRYRGKGREGAKWQKVQAMPCFLVLFPGHEVREVSPSCLPSPSSPAFGSVIILSHGTRQRHKKT